MNERQRLLFAVGLAALVAFGAGVWSARHGDDGEPASPAAGSERKPLFYRNPMNPNITSPTPAKDEMGMDYIPVYEGEAESAESGLPTVTIRPEVVNNLGVRSEPVRREELARRIDTVGYVDFDEQRLSHVHLRASGWVEELRVRSVGAKVAPGDLLFRFYSPELVNAQQEYLQSLAAGDRVLVRASEDRLEALGIPDDTLREIKASRRPQQLVPVYARHGGVVSQINIREGMYVGPEMETLTLANLDQVWLLADIFERQADWVSVGQKAEIHLPALPGTVLKGRVEYIYPTLDPRTRTLKVRLSFDNPRGELKPNMYAEATLLARPVAGVLTVPRSALIRTQEETRVVLDLGEGRFKPAIVETGIESGDRVEVVAGLEEGQTVVVSAQFLLDSESNLKASLQRMTAPAATTATPPQPGHAGAHSSAAEPATPPSPATALFHGQGSIEAIDLPHRTLTITHEPIPELGWPAMTMDFQAGPKVKLNGLRQGQRVEFDLRQIDPVTYELAAIRPAEGHAGGHP